MTAARLPSILVACAVLLVFSATASAQNIFKGYLAHERGDYATALQEWRPLAEQGSALAQLSLGLMYLHGRGVPQNYAEAARWLRLSAEQGDEEAQYNLGVSYFKCAGVSQDYVLAHKWINLAAARGHEEAPDARSRMTPAQISEAQRLARKWSAQRR